MNVLAADAAKVRIVEMTEDRPRLGVSGGSGCGLHCAMVRVRVIPKPIDPASPFDSDFQPMGRRILWRSALPRWLRLETVALPQYGHVHLDVGEESGEMAHRLFFTVD